MANLLPSSVSVSLCYTSLIASSHLKTPLSAQNARSSGIIGYMHTALSLIYFLDLKLGSTPGFHVLLRPVNVASSICNLSTKGQIKLSLNGTATITMYRLRSASFSAWKRFRSLSTPALASLTSFSQTSNACSSYRELVGSPKIVLDEEISRSTCLKETLFCLAHLIPSCPFRIDIYNAMNSMIDATK